MQMHRLAELQVNELICLSMKLVGYHNLILDVLKAIIKTELNKTIWKREIYGLL